MSLLPACAQGEVEMEMELLPLEVAQKPSYFAAVGKEGWLKDSNKNGPGRVIPQVVRPETSFPWYRLDKQICFRIKYCCKRARGPIIISILSSLLVAIAIVLIKQYVL